MSKLAAHIIPFHWGQEDDDRLKRWQPKAVKIVDPDPNRVKSFYALCPQSLFVLRDHPLSEQRSDMANAPEATGVRHADEWRQKLNTWQLGIPANQILVLGINEPAVWEVLDATVRYTVAFLNRCKEHGIRAGALSLSVGWPANTGTGTPPNWTPYQPVMDAIRAGNHLLILHEYWDHRGPSHNWTWWAGRYQQLPHNVSILIGECGLDEYVSNPQVDVHHRGWQGQVSPEQYLEHLADYDRRLQEDARIYAACIFTWDFAGREWQSFDIKGIAARLPQNTDFTLPVGPLPGIPADPEPPQPAGQVPPLVHPIEDPVKRRISQVFGARPAYYARWGLKGHNGLDYGVPTGTPIRAVSDGIAVNEDFDADGYGLYAKILHAWGESLYAHLDKRTTGPGQAIRAGAVIGLSGNSGNSEAPHLHLAVRVHPYNRNDGWRGYIDPQPYLERGIVQPAESDIDLLAKIITAEARGESLEGQLAIAHVALNRVARPGWWGTTLREVLTKPAQFSPPMPHTETAFAIASLAVAGLTLDPAPSATNFHSGPAPAWAADMQFIKRIGNHFFYRA